MQRLLVLGSTGSIGRQTLDVVRNDPQARRIVGLAARKDAQQLLAQVHEFRPPFVALLDEEAAEWLRPRVPRETSVLAGPEALVELCQIAEYDLAVHGVVGAAGVAPSEVVLRRGKTLALANKESLVVAGAHLVRMAQESGATIVPVDSEHSAVFQCLRGESMQRVRKVILTASGGPLRTTPRERLAHTTVEQALAHPNWRMGPRITIGSATLMNKALEIIELHHLFGLERERIEVVVHPQSVVHSMVEFVDGSVIAQLGPPDMRVPIHYALHHPDRAPSPYAGFDVRSMANLSFEAPDLERFPALALGWRVIAEGSDAGAVLNAADEVAVEAFLAGRIGFTDITRLVERALTLRPGLDQSISALLQADAQARELTANLVHQTAAARAVT
jgi:1-deoxy-D-xylulose-5-phosphate reductoisomerase